MTVEQYLQQLENACHKSLSATKSHGVRGAKMAQLQCVKEIRTKLVELQQLQAIPPITLPITLLVENRCERIVPPIFTWKKIIENGTRCDFETGHTGPCGVK